MKEKKNQFSGQTGFVLAAAGSAVSVGNLWRFPYLAAKDGGGLFLIVYLALVVVIAGYSLTLKKYGSRRRDAHGPSGLFVLHYAKF